jgi:hypothetical protein
VKYRPIWEASLFRNLLGKKRPAKKSHNSSRRRAAFETLEMRHMLSGLPVVTSISPTAGPLAGGTSVAIQGADFTGATVVEFGTVPVSTFTIGSDSQITVNSPAEAAGTVDVTVGGPGGTSTTSSADQFTYTAAPSVTSITPTAGPLSGGTTVTIVGAGFTGTTAVDFGSVAATKFNFISDTEITATSPAASAAGAVDVTVVNPGGTSPTLTADQFTYTAVPTVSTVSPAAGPLNGGTTVTITGTGFTNATGVDFGLVAANNFTVGSDGQSITATSPSESLGTVDVRVITAGGTSPIVSSDQFTYTNAPAVTSISPTSGPLAGGTTVTINGTDFTEASAVDFGTVAASSFSIVSATQISATSPAGSAAGVVDVTVTGPGGTSTTSIVDQYTYTSTTASAPAVTAVSPTAGPLAGGTTVTIAGTGFTDATAVDFGSVAASGYTVNSDGQITATSPAGSAGTVDVTVVTAEGTSATSSADQFTYQAVPTVTAVSPPAGPLAGNTTVTITGTGFTNATAVDFGTVAASGFTFLSATEITATTPAGSAGVVDVTVVTPGGTSAISSSDEYTYTNAPVVTGVSPTAGPLAGGTTVTITGVSFTDASAVEFGTVAASSFTVVSSTQITATSPAASTAGAVDVTVVSSNGTSTTSSSDQFTYDAVPAVTAVSPTAGPLAGGTTVTITGTGFTGASVVDFGTVAASSFTVVSATEITAASPAASAGTVDVTVATPGGTSTTSSADQFTYTTEPLVTSVSPTSGPLAGATSVTITGANFTDAAAVDFGTVAASSFTVVSDTQITATSPAASAAGAVDVTVVSSNGTSTTSSADQFTYTSTSTSVPAAPTGLSLATSSGVAGTTNYTTSDTPTLTLTAATGDTVQILNGSVVVATATETTAGSGQYSATIPAGQLAVGANSITATASNSSGQSSPTTAVSLIYAPSFTQTYEVPGSLGGTENITFIYTSKQAAYQNEMGYFIVDDASGSIDGLSPSSPGYAKAAMSSATMIFSQSTQAGSQKTVTLNSGQFIAFYLVENGSSAEFLAFNPSNSPFGTMTFFSVDAANPDNTRHVQTTGDPTTGSVQYSWEDMYFGGYLNYNAMVVSLVPSAVTGQTAAAVRVPGSSADAISANFTLQSSQKGYGGANSATTLPGEVGAIIVGENDTIGGVAPGSSGYAAAALAALSSTTSAPDMLFASGASFGTEKTLSLTGNELLVFYSVSSGTLANFLSVNPNNTITSGEPNVFFSVEAANPDAVSHFQWHNPGLVANTPLPLGAASDSQTLHVMDEIYGTTQDFDDFKISMQL